MRLLKFSMTGNHKYIAGVDEAGRGALAGPVIAAAVIMEEPFEIRGLTDSKKLSRSQRERLAPILKEKCLAWSIGVGSVQEIDEINILKSTLQAMKRAVESLLIRPDEVVVDGSQLPAIDMPAEAIVKGDLLVPIISAASVLAKVTRDQMMRGYADDYPQYGFEKNVGYGTAFHLKALSLYGISPIHRLSFSPVAAANQQKLFESSP